MIEYDRPGEPGCARLVNRRWGFTAEWVALSLALEQFESHPPDLRDGLVLEWQRGDGAPDRFDPVQIRSLIASLTLEVAQ